MSSPNDLLDSIRQFAYGLTLLELLARHADVPRRTAQRWLRQSIVDGQLRGAGEGRARRYLAVKMAAFNASATEQDSFPSSISLSADSRDILAYVDQALEARKPVGYRRDFLDTYEPNQT